MQPDLPSQPTPPNRRSLEVLERVCALQDGLIQTEVPDRWLFEALLQHLIEFTGSRFGFIGEVEYEGNAPVLRSWALTDISWNPEIKAFYDSRAQGGLVFRNLDTLFGHVLRTGETLIANDAVHHPKAAGVPAGHPPLDAFLGLPVHVKGRFAGMIGLANRPGGYDADMLRELSPLIGTASSMFHMLGVHRARISAEAAVSRRLAFERMILEISGRFIHAGPGDFDAMVGGALERVGTFVQADRAYLFLIRDGDELMDNTHEWCAAGISPEKDNLQSVPLVAMEVVFEPLRSGRPLFVPDVSSLPPEAQAVREALEPQGIKSLVLVPVLHENRLQGFLGFDACREHRAWSRDDVALLQVMSEDVGHLLRRTRAAARLAESERRLRLIASHVPQAFFLVARDYSQMLYVSPAFEDIWGLSCATVYADPLSWVPSMHEDDREAVVATFAVADREETVTEYRIRRPDGTIRWVRVQTLPVRADSGEVEQIAGIAEDVTERRRVAETMARHREALEEAVRLRTEELTTANGQLRAEIAARARAEDELRRSTSALRTVADAMPVSVAIVEHGIVRFANRSAGESFGLAIGTDLEVAHPPLAEVGRLESARREVELVRRDGEARELFIVSRPVDFEGRPCQVMAGVDVTEQRRAERLIREHQATIARIAHVGNMEGLASAVAHELNQPLASMVNWIAGLTARASRGPVGQAEFLEILERLRAQALRAGEMMRRLRSFSNRTDVQRLRLDMDGICTRAAAELAEVAAARGIRIQLDLNAQGSRVLGDAVQLEIVLTNLLRNAMDAMDAKMSPDASGERAGAAPFVPVVTLRSWRNAEGVFVTVTDRGPGVPQALRASIFEPLVSTKTGGMGIGLPIARSIVEAHRGRIVLADGPPEDSVEGACFEVFLPEATGVPDA